MNDNIVNCLLACGFVRITEKDIPDYTDIGENDNLSDYVDDKIYEFGYFNYENYCILKLNKDRGDAFLRCVKGSRKFIIKYDNELYIGEWSECKWKIGRDDSWRKRDSEIFKNFKKDMIENNMIFYFSKYF